MIPHHGRCLTNHVKTNQVPDRVRSAIAYRVAAGFNSEAEIVEHALDLAELARDAADLRPEIERLTAQRVVLHQAMQSRWDYPTDCQRLDLAFKMLNRHGVVARQNLGGCFECGIDQIEAEIESARTTHRVKGYVFFTVPMFEYAILNGQLPLFHGVVADDCSSETIAETIVRELRNTCRDARWDGRAASPVIVDRMLWRKRR
jgi:hypothetical protein